MGAGADVYALDMERARTAGEVELRRGPWTPNEDQILAEYIGRHGEGRWNCLARLTGLKRTGKSCRLRWLNYLRPDVRRGNITPEEQLLILELHSLWGNRWSKIARHLPGRTDNEVKNYWRTRVQKHAKQLLCDVNSQQFKDVVRRQWMPRLMERIRATSSGSASSGGAAPGYCVVPSALPGPEDHCSVSAFDCSQPSLEKSGTSDSSAGTKLSARPRVSEILDAQSGANQVSVDDYAVVDDACFRVFAPESLANPCGDINQGDLNFQQYGWSSTSGDFSLEDLLSDEDFGLVIQQPLKF